MAHDDPLDSHQEPESGDPQWDNNPIYGPSTVIAALDQVEQLMTSARSVPLSASVVVNKAEILDLIDQARDALPEDMVAADAVVADADAVLGRADSAAEVTITEAQTRAKAMVAQAQDQADQLVREAQETAKATTQRANAQAERTRQQAREEADAIVEDANAQAQRLIQSERISQMAEDRARSIVAEAHAEEAKLKYGADDYAAKALSELSKLLTDLQHRTDAGRRTIADRSGRDRTDMDLGDK